MAVYLDQLQEKLESHIEVQEQLSLEVSANRLNILSERKGDIVSGIEKKIASLKAAVIVMAPEGRPSADHEVALRINARTSVVVIERPTMNTGGLSALRIVHHIMEAVHGAMEPDCSAPLFECKGYTLTTLEVGRVKDAVAYLINFESVIKIK